MRAEPDRPLAMQCGLFLPAVPDPEKLELTLARIASVVGENNVGSPELLDSHRPDAFRMQKFVAAAPAAASGKENGGSKIGFRAIRPRVPANVEFHGGQPVHIWFRGRSGKVVHASGPWRCSGEWWQERGWQEDAWDLEVRFSKDASLPSLAYCIVFDSLQKEWFVRGSYD
jgi:protein ImuB